MMLRLKKWEMMTGMKKWLVKHLNMYQKITTLKTHLSDETIATNAHHLPSPHDSQMATS